MDPILGGYISDYLNKKGEIARDQGDAFEKFSNHCIIARDFPSGSETPDITIGGSNDTGIDGIAIFANGIYVENFETFEYLATRTRVNVDFVFIQSKSAQRVSASEVGSFGEGVFSFFKSTGMKENEHISHLKKLKDKIFGMSARFANRPCAYFYFCTASNFSGDANVDARAASVVSRLKELGYFHRVEFRFLNKNKLTVRYDEIRLKIEREIHFERHAVFPEIDGIRQAYIGLLSSKEYLKLITNSDGELQRNLFSENIRDYLGHNKVNAEIAQTLRTKSAQPKLPALNNGITIVAKEISSVGNKFSIRDYQIVNGCQTSN